MGYSAGDVGEYVDAAASCVDTGDCDDLESLALDVLQDLADEYLDDLVGLARAHGLPALYDGLVAAGMPEEMAWVLTAAVDLGSEYAAQEAMEELGLQNALADFRRAADGQGSASERGLWFDYGPGTELWEGVKPFPMPYTPMRNPVAVAFQPIAAVATPLALAQGGLLHGIQSAPPLSGPASELALHLLALLGEAIKVAMDFDNPPSPGEEGIVAHWAGKSTYGKWVAFWDAAREAGHVGTNDPRWQGVTMWPRPWDFWRPSEFNAYADIDARRGLPGATLWDALDASTSTSGATGVTPDLLAGLRELVNGDAEARALDEAQYAASTELAPWTFFAVAKPQTVKYEAKVRPHQWARARKDLARRIKEERKGMPPRPGPRIPPAPKFVPTTTTEKTEAPAGAGVAAAAAGGLGLLFLLLRG